MRTSAFLPVKNMVYDALEYAGQVENSARSHREARQWPSTSGEYLTGFYKDDRLIPVIPTVVYFGSDTWKAPRSLHEMLSVQDPEILSLVPDYRINLFSPAEIEYSRAMKSHFRKFGNQMSGSGNHLCNYASLLA